MLDFPGADVGNLALREPRRSVGGLPAGQVREEAPRPSCLRGPRFGDQKSIFEINQLGSESPSAGSGMNSRTSAALPAITVQASSSRSSGLISSIRTSALCMNSTSGSSAVSPSEPWRVRQLVAPFRRASESSAFSEIAKIRRKSVSRAASGNCFANSRQRSGRADFCQYRQARHAQAWGGLGGFIRHQPLRVEAGQRVASLGLLPDPVHWRRLRVKGFADSGVGEFLTKATTMSEFLRNARWGHNFGLVVHPVSAVVKDSAVVVGVSAIPKRPG